MDPCCRSPELPLDEQPNCPPFRRFSGCFLAEPRPRLVERRFERLRFCARSLQSQQIPHRADFLRLSFGPLLARQLSTRAPRSVGLLSLGNVLRISSDPLWPNFA